MSEIEVAVLEEEVNENEPKPFLDAARKVLLASIGALALAQDEIEDFVNRLVERGEIAEKEGSALIKDLMERRKEKAQKAKGDVTNEMDERIEALLHRMNIPTRGDIEALSQKIAALNEKVDALEEAQGTSNNV